MGEWDSSDYLLNNDTDLKELWQEWKYLMKIINEFDKQRINQKKEEKNKMIQETQQDISEILSLSDPTISYKWDGNKQIYDIDFWWKKFKVYACFKRWIGELDFDKFLLNNEIDFKDLWKEWKYLVKIINEFDKKELNKQKEEKNWKIENTKEDILEVLKK